MYNQVLFRLGKVGYTNTYNKKRAVVTLGSEAQHMCRQEETSVPSSQDVLQKLTQNPSGRTKSPHKTVDSVGPRFKHLEFPKLSEAMEIKWKLLSRV